MKKRILLTILAAAVCAAALPGQNIREDREIKTLQIPEDGRAKLGLLLGYPSGGTFGYRFSNWFELNFTAGYTFSPIDSAIVSTNGLFTLLNIPVGDAGVMPLSLGPQVNFVIGGQFYLETVVDLRLEYTFRDIPLNIFLESGIGLRFLGNPSVDLAWNSGLGVRYVF